MKIELIIANGEKYFSVSPLDGMKWDTERRGVAGKLMFSYIGKPEYMVRDRSAVRLKVDDKPVFYGFVTKYECDGSDAIKITACDWLCYLKYKDTYQYSGKTAADVIRLIATSQTPPLPVGTLAQTKYVIPRRIETRKTLFDIVLTALDMELLNTGNEYIFFDDFGKLTLKNLKDMVVPFLIDRDTAQGLTFTSATDGNTYNKIKLYRENKDTGKRDIYIAQDSENIRKWGVLQYYESLKDGEDGVTKANALLKLYNLPEKSLKIKGQFGDTRVRGGSLVGVRLSFGNEKVNNYMMVEKCSHTLSDGAHTMDLTMRGNTIYG